MVKKYKRILVIFLIIVMLMPFGTHIFADTQDIQQNQYAYTGFSGIYQQICVNGKVVYQEDNNFWLSDDDTLTTEQQKAQFLPRDMGDGSYAFENRLTENRIATAEDNKELLATIYNFRGYFNKRAEDYEGLNDDTQHWILEKTDKENEYYLKSLENNLYMGVSDENKLIAVSNENKAVFTFNPLYNESPLYQLSINSGYARLTELQRERLERVYESVAGDVFDRTGQYFENKDVPKETPRAKIDNIYKEVSENNNDSNTCFTKLNSYLKPNNAFVSLQLLNHLHISKELPGTENVRSEIVSNGQELPDKSIGDGKRYQCSINIYDKNNNLEQTISMTIIDSGLSVITNARMFAKILTYIPYVLRKNITTASCYKSFSSSGKFLTDLHSIEIALVAGSTEEGMLDSVVHELGHSIDRGYGNSYHFSSHGEWSKRTRYFRSF